MAPSSSVSWLARAIERRGRRDTRLAADCTAAPRGCLGRFVSRTAALLVALPAVATASPPELLWDQVAGHSYVSPGVRLGATIVIAPVSLPVYGLAKYDIVARTGILIEAPPFEGSTEPVVVGEQVFFRGIPVDGDGFQRLYRVDGDASVELAASSDDYFSAREIWDLDGLALFAFDDGVHGVELWSSDGTPAGTRMIKDIDPSGSSIPAYGFRFDGLLYFSADDGVNGRELWRTDGTRDGTILFKDIEPGAGDSLPYRMTRLDSSLFVFAASTAATGVELFRCDGTEAGTVLIDDAIPGVAGSEPREMARAGSWIYFSADTQGFGRELHRSDGYVVEFVKDICTGSCSSTPYNLTSHEGDIYFEATDGDHGRELWRSGGTGWDTELFFDASPGDASTPISEMVAHQGLLYVATISSSESDLWRVDGSTGTMEPLDVFPSGLALPSGLMGIGTGLFLGVDDGSGTGHEFRRFDPSTEEFELICDLNTRNGSYAEDLVAFGADLLAIADLDDSGRDLWLYRTADPDSSLSLDPEFALYRSDQMPPGAEFVVSGDRIFLTTSTPDTGNEPAVYDDGEVHIVELIPGEEGSTPSEITVVGNRVYFVAETSAGGYGLFRLFGPPNERAELVYDFGNRRPRELTELGDDLLFVGAEGSDGTELWKSNGVETRRLLDIYPGAAGSAPASLTRMGDHVYFVAAGPGTGRELWCTDGREDGTHIVANLAPGVLDSHPEQLTDGFPFLYFVATTDDTGAEIYRATSAGAEALGEIVPGPGSGDPQHLAFAVSRLRFSADDGTGSGREPWTLQGTTPVQMFDLNPGSGSSDPADFGEHRGALFFSADNGSAGRELWRAADGVLSLASMGIAPGSLSSDPGDRASIGDRLYFVADSPEVGREIWFLEDEGGSAGAPPPPELASAGSVSLRSGPNPFRDRLELELRLPRASTVRAEIVDATGRIVTREEFGPREAGMHTLRWAPAGLAGLASGVYFLRVEAGDEAVVRKLSRLR